MAEGRDDVGSLASNMDKIEQALLGLTTVIQNNNGNGVTGNIGGVIEDAIHTDQPRVDPLQRGRCKYMWGRM